ncbi:heavy-metal-associated domain-containing protein [Pontibacter rugosus]|uniref:Heavy-metal-associated domain-containing protein n=1 Tax=Pontibacter rugosus TaxID=1745966 RepID=A0ABW3SNX3_9BACT
MRKNILTIAFIIGPFAAVSVQAQEANTTTQTAVAQATKTATFGVGGKCGMCKNRIEEATLGLEGVKLVNWNLERKVLTVKYDPAKVSEADIQKQVASVGHDTEKVKASDEAYNSLPGCCQYERM